MDWLEEHLKPAKKVIQDFSRASERQSLADSHTGVLPK
jgi:hypothetical protein